MRWILHIRSDLSLVHVQRSPPPSRHAIKRVDDQQAHWYTDLAWWGRTTEPGDMENCLLPTSKHCIAKGLMTQISRELRVLID